MPVDNGSNGTSSPVTTADKSAEHPGAVAPYEALKEKMGISHLHPDMPKTHDGNFKQHPLSK